MSLLTFEAVCWTLAAVYMVVGIISLFQLIVLHQRENGPALSLFLPKTVQQKVHFIIVLLCSVRASFFFVTVGSWDPEEGIVTSNKVAFYSLDELSTVLFFTLACTLALFWAELYYISVDKLSVFTSFVRPITNALNVSAYLAVAVCTYLDTTAFAGDSDYIYVHYSLLIAITYIFAAVIFGYYARAAAQELRVVPIHLATRQQRLNTLKGLAYVCITALLTRAIIVISLTGRILRTTSLMQQLLLFLYYFILELVPTITAVAFYRVELIRMEDQGELWERSPLTNSGSRAQGSRTPDEIITSLIARLSADNTSTNSDQSAKSLNAGDPGLL